MLIGMSSYQQYSNVAEMSTTSTTQPMTPDGWVPLTLLEKKKLTEGDRPTYLFRFSVSKDQDPFPVSSCLLTRAPVGEKNDNGDRKFVIRPYTPVSHPDSKESVDLAIKIYGDGKLTPHMEGMKPGDAMEFKGPIVKLKVEEAQQKSGIGMVAGGTGITPMLQMARELLESKGYQKKISLVYGSLSPDEIMLKDKIDALAASYPNFKVTYIVDKVPKGQTWNGGVGYVTKNLLDSTMPSPSDGDSLVLVCGPPGMMKAVSGPKVSPKDQGELSGLLLDMGFTKQQVFKY